MDQHQKRDSRGPQRSSGAYPKRSASSPQRSWGTRSGTTPARPPFRSNGDRPSSGPEWKRPGGGFREATPSYPRNPVKGYVPRPNSKEKLRESPAEMHKRDTSWGHVADWYDDLLSSKDTYQEKVVLPNLLRLIEPKEGDTILDLACGQGFFSNAFAEKGATVVGVDIGKELVAKAERSNERVRFFVSPSHKLPMLGDASVDTVAIVLAIQNIAHVDETLAEIKRVLKTDGELIIVMNHPTFRVPKASSWGWDNEHRIQYRRVDEYLSESKSTIDMHPGKSADGETPELTISFHRPLQYYFKVFGKHGFGVDRLEEWISHKESNSGPRKDAENKARNEIPLFLALRAKVFSTTQP